MKIKIFVLAAVLLLCTACSKPKLPTLRLIEQQSGTKASLRGLSVVNARVAWASGSSGTVLRTANGGDAWTLITVPGCEEIDFRDIQAWDEDLAILMGIGSPARFFRTEDSGQTWKQVYLNHTPGVFFDCLAFWDDKYGVAMSDPINNAFLLIRTENGGRTWEEVPAENIPEPMEGEAGFAASGTGMTVFEGGLAWFGTGGGAARVIFSTDYGKTWSAAETPVRADKPSQGIFSVVFTDINNGVIVGGDYASDMEDINCAAVSVDGGKTWKVSQDQPAGFRSCVTVVDGSDPLLFIAAGTSGISISSDLGNTWTEADSTGFHCVDFAEDGKTGWLTGSKGRITKINLQ